jgi:hypothetical protein
MMRRAMIFLLGVAAGVGLFMAAMVAIEDMVDALDAFALEREGR